MSASLRLRFRSAVFSRAWGNLVKICQHILTISLLRRGARLSYGRGLPLRRAGGALTCGLPRACEASSTSRRALASLLGSGTRSGQPLPPVLRPRAGGNLIQTRITRLNDFLLQQSRAGRALSARLGKSCQNAPAHFDDFLLRRGARLSHKRGLRSGRAGPTSRGRAKLRFAIAASTQSPHSKPDQYINKNGWHKATRYP